MPSEDDLYEIEVLDGELVHPHGELVPPPTPPLEHVDSERLPARAAQPAVQTAVVAATGFVAGAATMALLRRYGQARLERAPAPPPPVEPPRPSPVRTYLVHVRPLG